MPENANSIDNGIASATISPARKLPKKKNTTAVTSRAPSQRLLRTVAITWSTSLERS
jgi:hypothetical protein